MVPSASLRLLSGNYSWTVDGRSRPLCHIVQVIRGTGKISSFPSLTCRVKEVIQVHLCASFTQWSYLIQHTYTDCFVSRLWRRRQWRTGSLIGGENHCIRIDVFIFTKTKSVRLAHGALSFCLIKSALQTIRITNQSSTTKIYKASW